MPYRVVFTEEADEQLARLPEKIQRQIAGKLRLLADNPRPPRVKRLAQQSHLYRIRSGDYRVLYQIEDDLLLVLVVRVALRRDAYHGLPRGGSGPHREDERAVTLTHGYAKENGSMSLFYTSRTMKSSSKATPARSAGVRTVKGAAPIRQVSGPRMLRVASPKG